MTGRIPRQVPLSSCLELDSGACLQRLPVCFNLSHDWSLDLSSLSDKTCLLVNSQTYSPGIQSPKSIPHLARKPQGHLPLVTPGLTEPPRHPPAGSPGQMNRLPTRLQLHDPTIPLRRRRRPRYLPPFRLPALVSHTTKMGDVPTQPGQTKAKMRRGASPIQRRPFSTLMMMMSSARARLVTPSSLVARRGLRVSGECVPAVAFFSALRMGNAWSLGTTARDSLLVGGAVAMRPTIDVDFALLVGGVSRGGGPMGRAGS